MATQNQYEKNLLAIKNIGQKNLGNTIKGNARYNMRGALIGGGVGVVLGLASRSNVYIFGLIGLIAGRLLLAK